MDFKTIREQILSNLDNFDTDERRVIILKLLDFLKQFEDENKTLKDDNQLLAQENDALKDSQVDEEAYKAKVEEIIDLAHKEADVIIEEAHKEVDDKLTHADDQGKEVIYDLLVRMESLVKELRDSDLEAKAYRFHIMTIFKKTIFKFADSDYHILKINDADLKKLMKFYKEDDELQVFSDQIMLKLENFERYLNLCESKIKNEEYDNDNIDTLENILSGNFVLESTDLTDDKSEPVMEEVIVEEPETIEKEPVQEDIAEVEHKNKEVEDTSKEIDNDDKNNAKFIDIFNKYNN